MKVIKIVCAGAVATALGAPMASAEPTAEFLVQEAVGLLHHSCDSIVEATGGDEGEIVQVVEKMVAVSLVNRQIDLSQHAKSDEERETLRAAFIEQLRAGCEADRKALLAGIVDSAVKDVLGL